MSSFNDHLCAAKGCSEIGNLQCARCKDVYYCGKVCQLKSWPLHKGPCKVIAKAKEEAENAKEKDSTPSLKGVFCAAECGVQRGIPGVPPIFLRCDRCLGAFYCSRECQIKAWPKHKGPCKIATLDISYIGSNITEVDERIAKNRMDAEAGDAIAQCNLGLCYLKGSGVAIDKREAIKWYKLAAEAGNANAQLNLGCCYDNGDGVAVDKHEAFKWYKRAAEAGSVHAQYNLGLHYKKGDSVAVDKYESF